MTADSPTGLRIAGLPVPDEALPALVQRQLRCGQPWSGRDDDEVDGLVRALGVAGRQAPALHAAVVGSLGAEDPKLRGQAVDFLLRVGADAPAEAVARAMEDHHTLLEGHRHPTRALLGADLYDALLHVLTASATEADHLAIELMVRGATAGRPCALGLARLRPALLLARPELLPRRALGGALLKLNEPRDRLALVRAFAPYPDADELLPAPFWQRFGAEGAPVRALVEALRVGDPGRP